MPEGYSSYTDRWDMERPDMYAEDMRPFMQRQVYEELRRMGYEVPREDELRFSPRGRAEEGPPRIVSRGGYGGYGGFETAGGYGGFVPGERSMGNGRPYGSGILGLNAGGIAGMLSSLFGGR